MKILFLCVFTILYLSFLSAQTQKVRNEKIVETYVLVDSTKSQQLDISLLEPNDADWLYSFQALITDLSTRDTLQIFYGDYTTSEDLKYAFKLEDVNFDNISDLMVLTNIGNSGNENYDFWIYNPELKKYLFDKELTELIDCNPIIDSYNKTYRTGGFLGCASMCWSYSTYKYLNGKLIEIEEETQEYTDSLNSENIPIFRRYLKKLQGNKLEIVKDVSGTIEQIEQEWE